MLLNFTNKYVKLDSENTTLQKGFLHMSTAQFSTYSILYNKCLIRFEKCFTKSQVDLARAIFCSQYIFDLSFTQASKHIWTLLTKLLAITLQLSKLRVVEEKHISYACMTMDFGWDFALLSQKQQLVFACGVAGYGSRTRERCENIKDYDTFA